MSRLSVSVIVVTIGSLCGAPAQAQTAAKSTAKAAGVTVTPKSGREGTKVTITYPSAVKDFPNAMDVLIEDPGVHGYYFAHDAGIYITYDGHRDSKYTVPATAVSGSAKKNAYEFTIPDGVCGVILQSTQATVTKVPAGAIQGSPTVVGQHVTKYPTKSSSGGKKLEMSIVGQKGKPATFSLTCDKYTVSVNLKADPTDVSPVPGASMVTATVAAKGAVQAVVGAKVKTPPNTPNAIIPIGRINVLFTTSFGTLSDTQVVTGTDGKASPSVSSDDPGQALVQAVAQGLGDGHATVKFSGEKKKQESKPANTLAIDDGASAQQCADAVQKRHHDIVSSLQGHPTHEIAAAIADSDAKNPSVAECSKKKSGGGGDDTTPGVGSNSTGDPALDGVEKDANDATKQQTTPGATAPPDKKPNPNTKKLLIGGGAAAAGVAAIALGHGGGGSSSPSGSTGTPSGGGGSTKWDPSGANGDFSGPVNLQPGGCAGSDQEFLEKVSVHLNSVGSGTVVLNDSPSFSPRSYNVSGITEYNVTVTAQGSYPFFGAQIPGTLSVSFQSNTQATVKEVTNWGSCSNGYQGTVSR